MGNFSLDQYTALMTDYDREITNIVFFAVVINLISIFGSVANVINIAVFIKQGFQDTVNISFLALTLSDLGSLLTMVAVGVTILVGSVWPEAPMVKEDVAYLIGDKHVIKPVSMFTTTAAPHAAFLRISWLITTFITIERCLCVTIPLKVKHIITATRTIIAMVSIYLCVFLGTSPFFVSSALTNVFNTATNATKLTRTFHADVYYTDGIGYNFTVSVQFGCIIVDLLSTLVIIRQMQVKWKWRLESTSASASDRLSLRDKKLVKMVLAILCVFIACLIPSCTSFVCELVYGYMFNITGPNYNIFICASSVIITFEVAHSSVNIFIYYNMSAKYNATFKQIFFKCDQR
ncbi:uncharacterized protein LOC131935514 [Physella acuta]|uniref:uncharacterized protein LOC131935514 n=1 Tax=Physella acuta TaxID=109671 RepID=UPI0027DABFC7|nr:uncharacterized protein LOC131935514 [Physella acuta]